MKAKDIAGQQFGQLKAIKKTGANSGGHVLWSCECSCGNSIEADGVSLRSGKRTSCDECSSTRRRMAATKHGLCETDEFWILEGMKSRCYNPENKRYSRYGGRGITICQRWLDSPLNFLIDLGPRPSKQHSIERNDRNGNYEPGNCRWATLEEQANNRSNNHEITIGGVTKNITKWSADTGVCRTVILRRLKRGLAGEDLIKKTEKRLITANGITDTASGWSRRTGISTSTITARIRNYGWSDEDAVNTGAKK